MTEKRAVGGASSSTILMWVTCTCAVLVTGMMAVRTFAPSSTGAFTAGAPSAEDQIVTGWDTLVAGGHAIGSTDPLVTILEFGDYECPACRRFHDEVLAPLIKARSDDIKLVYRHFPLPYHRFAKPFAIASECSARLGSFAKFHELAMATYDSLGLIPVESLAVRSGVRDIGQFGACLSDTLIQQRVERDAAVAQRLGARGTPTILINGVMLGNLNPTHFKEVLDSLTN